MSQGVTETLWIWSVVGLKLRTLLRVDVNAKPNTESNKIIISKNGVAFNRFLGFLVVSISNK